MTIIRILLILTALNRFAIPQELFDPYQVHILEISFYNPDYDQILQERWEVDDKTYELATVVFNGDTLDSVGVRYKGNSTFWWTQETGSPKYPLNIDFDLIYEDQDLLGYTKVKLSNSIFDATFVRETLGYLTESYYLPTSETGYMNVFINGELIGLYVSVESVNKPFLTKHFGNNEGTFFKCEPQFHYGSQYDAWPDMRWYGSDSMEYAYQKGYELKSETGWTDLLDLIYTLNFNLDSIETILNVDRVLWLFASSNVMPDLDAYTGLYMHNYYLYRNSVTELFEIIPWDKDHTFGGAQINDILSWGGNVTVIYQWDPFLYENDDIDIRPLFSQLMSVPLYKKIYTAHMRTIINDIYDVEYIQALAYEMQDSIETYAYEDPNLFPPFTFGDYFRYNVDNYLIAPGGSHWCGITSTVNARLQFLLTHNEILKTAPEILYVYQENTSPENGDDVIIQAAVTGAESVELMVTINEGNSHFLSVAMSDDGQNGDGDADDNIFGAMVPFNLNGDHIKYYIRASNEDALVLEPGQAEWDFYHYMVGDQSLPDSTIVINEINYHSPDDHNSGDWVELHNPTDASMDMGNWIFKDEDDGHIFSIPDATILDSGDFLVLSEDTASFTAMFPDVNQFVGNLNFGFEGGGELLRLYNSNNALVDTVSYNDADPWPQEPDGNGPTIELIHPFQDNAMAENWAASEGYGTPGSVNSVYLVHEYEPNLPTQFHVINNYPNPFNPSTTITYELVREQKINISIFDMLGRQVKTLVNEKQTAGLKRMSWNATNNLGKPVAGGVYLCSIMAGESRKSIKMVLLK